MTKTLRDLVLAVVNATLILIALCLFLGWKLSDTVDGILSDFARNIEVVVPLRTDVQAMTDELREMRADLARLRDTELAGPRLDAVQMRLDQVSDRVDGLAERVDGITALPQTMLDQSIAQLGVEAARVVNGVRGCSPAGNV